MTLKQIKEISQTVEKFYHFQKKKLDKMDFVHKIKNEENETCNLILSNIISRSEFGL